MSPEIILVLSLTVGMIVLFVFEILPVELIGLLMMVAVMALGLVSPEEGVSGFSNQAVVTILALMIIGAAMDETGTVQVIGYKIKGLFYLPEWQSIGLLMLIIGTVSAFINTTAVVIVFLSVLLKISDKIPTNLSKLLIPMSFAGILGGSCSLMGTSTNLLVSSISEEAGEAAFGFFEFTPIGLGLFAVSFVYMVLIGRHLLPERVEKGQVEEDFSKKYFSTIITVNEGSGLTKKPLHQTILSDREGLSILSVGRGKEPWRLPYRFERLRSGDRLLIRANAAQIKSILDSEKVTLLNEKQVTEMTKAPKQFVLCEALLKPNSRFIGRQIRNISLWQEYNIILLGVHQAKKVSDLLGGYFSPAKALKNLMYQNHVEVGDSLLVLVAKDEITELSNTRDFVLLREFHELHHQPWKIRLSLGILAGVVILAATNVLPILVSALAGALLMALTGCITLSRAFRSVNWSILFLLAGMIPMGIAISNSGADKYLADMFVEHLPSQEPLVIIGAMFGLTALLSSVLSNNASAILLAPIALSLSATLGIPAKPLLFAVMFGANTSYFTPIGYQTNTLIYNPGNYRFRDFMLVGGLLTVIISVVATYLIYWVTMGE